MKRILFDVNVVLDVLLDREPHAEASSAAWAAVEEGVAEGLIAAHAVTTIHYLAKNEKSNAIAVRTMSALLRVFRVAMIDEIVLREALSLSCPDFEDAVSAAAARIARCDYIATRDPKEFRGSLVRPLTPEILLPLLTGSR